MMGWLIPPPKEPTKSSEEFRAARRRRVARLARQGYLRSERIRQADADQDGALSVDELVEVIRAEVRAVSDRKLFRNILISLFVTVLVLVATLCGTVYAIVDLSKEVKNDNGMLVSSSSGDVMATGTAQLALTLGPELLSLLHFPSSLGALMSLSE